MRHDQGQKDAYGTSTQTSNNKNGDRKLGQKGKQEDRHRGEFEMKNRAERKLEQNRKSKARETEQKGKTLGNRKGSGAWKKTEWKHRKRKYGI